MIERTLTPLKNHSYFLFGPRQTGKSTFVRAVAQEKDLYINLLPQRNFLTYAKDPGVFRQEIIAHFQKAKSFKCIVDEIQKIPALLDEIHDLIESYGIEFILTGSSARKLKRGAANLLAGRAYTYHLYPLTYEELGNNFNLDRFLLRGALPYLWSHNIEQREEEEFLRAYSETYLKEEIQAEGILRNIGPFVHFLDIVASNEGEVVNYSNIARECGVSVKTVQEYYQILEDTFLAYKILPWTKSLRKRLIAHPRYYLFDTGITNALCQQYSALNPVSRGRRFEQFIVLQILALNSYYRLDWQLFFWRTNIGSEIDLLLVRSGQILAAVEIKSTTNITDKDAHSLIEFQAEHPKTPLFIVAPVDKPRLQKSGVSIVPWREFLDVTLRSL